MPSIDCNAPKQSTSAFSRITDRITGIRSTPLPVQEIGITDSGGPIAPESAPTQADRIPGVGRPWDADGRMEGDLEV